MFTIDTVERIDTNTVRARVFMPLSEFNTAKRKGALGALYGIDISNALSRGYGVKAYAPTVDVNSGGKGVKIIDLYYQDNEWLPVPDNVVHVDFKAKKRIVA